MTKQQLLGNNTRPRSLAFQEGEGKVDNGVRLEVADSSVGDVIGRYIRRYRFSMLSRTTRSSTRPR